MQTKYIKNKIVNFNRYFDVINIITIIIITIIIIFIPFHLHKFYLCFNKIVLSFSTPIKANQLKLWSPSCKDDNKLNKTNESVAMHDKNNKSAIQSNSSSTVMPNLFTICLRLLSVIYERDSRHLFTPPDFWLIS